VLVMLERRGLGVHSCAIGLYDTESEGTNAEKLDSVLDEITKSGFIDKLKR
jgi:hypothetical protein